jgi:hypothetical protein
MLGAKPLSHRQPVAERDRHAVDEDRRRHILRMPARIGADVLLLAPGRRQNSLGDRLQARLGKRLDPRRHKTDDHALRMHKRNLGGRSPRSNAIAYQRVRRRDRLR